jgi:hypothetical protein
MGNTVQSAVGWKGRSKHSDGVGPEARQLLTAGRLGDGDQAGVRLVDAGEDMAQWTASAIERLLIARVRFVRIILVD